MEHDSLKSNHLLTNDYKTSSETLGAAAQRPPSGNNLRAALRGEVVDEVVSEVVVCKAVDEVVRWKQ